MIWDSYLVIFFMFVFKLSAVKISEGSRNCLQLRCCEILKLLAGSQSGLVRWDPWGGRGGLTLLTSNGRSKDSKPVKHVLQTLYSTRLATVFLWSFPTTGNHIVRFVEFLSVFVWVATHQTDDQKVLGMNAAEKIAQVSQLERSNHTAFIENNVLFVWGGYQVRSGCLKDLPV